MQLLSRPTAPARPPLPPPPPPHLPCPTRHQQVPMLRCARLVCKRLPIRSNFQAVPASHSPTRSNQPSTPLGKGCGCRLFLLKQRTRWLQHAYPGRSTLTHTHPPPRPPPQQTHLTPDTPTHNQHPHLHHHLHHHLLRCLSIRTLRCKMSQRPISQPANTSIFRPEHPQTGL